MMWIQICARGVRGHAPPEFFIKIYTMLRILSVPKYVFIILKSTFLRIIFRNSKKIFAISVTTTNPDEHFSMKVNIFIFHKGDLGDFLPEAEDFFKKNKQNEGFSFNVRFVFTLLQGSLNPQNYELAPQILENNYQCSPAP